MFYEGRGTLTINKGYGFLYAYSTALGHFVLYCVGSVGVEIELARNGDSILVSKPSEYQTQITVGDNNDINAIFIGFV